MCSRFENKKAQNLRIHFQFTNLKKFEFHLYDNDFTRRWYANFEQVNNLVPKSTDWELQSQGTDIEDETWRPLQNIIEKINSHVPNTIPITLILDEYTLDDLYNVHLIYEHIAKDDTWVEQAHDQDIARQDRGLLNDIIHLLEAKSKKVKNFPRIRFRFVDPKTGQPNVPKYDFEESDYKLFTPWKEPYVLYLNYNAVGQEWEKQWKAYKQPSSAVPLTQWSPSFNMTFKTTAYETQQQRIIKMRQWMENGGYDPDDPKNSFGQIPLGRLFKDKDETEYFKILNTATLKKVWCN